MTRAQLDKAASKSARQARGMWDIIHRLEGEYGGSEWLALHLGRIWEENKDLKRRVRALERKAKRP